MRSTTVSNDTSPSHCWLAMIDDNPMEHMIFKKLCERHQVFSNATHFLMHA